MFSSAHRETHLVRLRAELAEAREKALCYDRVAVEEQPAVGLAVAVPEEHPRIRLQTALLRSWVDRRRLEDIKTLLRGKRYLLDEHVYIGNGETVSQTALEYATRKEYHDVVAVLREAAGIEEG